MRSSIRLSARDTGVPLGHRLLHLHCAAHRIDDAGKFHHQAVASGLDDAAVMLLDPRIEEFATQRFEAFDRPFLMRPRQPRIPRHIGGEDRNETTARGHSSGTPALRRPPRKRSPISPANGMFHALKPASERAQDDGGRRAPRLRFRGPHSLPPLL
jgi:hypothetical protein